jgi:hypothetical protein
MGSGENRSTDARSFAHGEVCVSTHGIEMVDGTSPRLPNCALIGWNVGWNERSFKF